VSQKSPPRGRRGREVVARDAPRPDQRSPGAVQRDLLDRELGPLLASKAVPHMATLNEAGMAGTIALGEPAGITPSGLASAAAKSVADPFAQRRDEARSRLLASAPRPSAAEAILYDVASRELAIYVELSEAQEKLARELHDAVSRDVRGALALSKVLREVTQIAGAIGRRVEHVLTTATSLRAQRRFLELQGGQDET
jgi:signal transduction histidine kinase